MVEERRGRGEKKTAGGEERTTMYVGERGEA